MSDWLTKFLERQDSALQFKKKTQIKLNQIKYNQIYFLELNITM